MDNQSYQEFVDLTEKYFADFPDWKKTVLSLAAQREEVMKIRAAAKIPEEMIVDQNTGQLKSIVIF